MFYQNFQQPDKALKVDEQSGSDVAAKDGTRQQSSDDSKDEKNSKVDKQSDVASDSIREQCRVDLRKIDKEKKSKVDEQSDVTHNDSTREQNSVVTSKIDKEKKLKVGKQTDVASDNTREQGSVDSSTSDKEKRSKVDKQTDKASDSTREQSSVDSSEIDKETEEKQGDDNMLFSKEEMLQLLTELFSEDEIVHNKFLCAKNCCSDISKTEKTRLLPKKFMHKYLNKKWWLCFVEGKGMFCLLCKKHNLRHKNNRDIFVNKPGQRFLPDAFNGHSSCALHKSARATELTQRVSIFQKEVSRKSEVETSIYEKVFHTAYFLMKSFIANRQLIPALRFIEHVYEFSDLKFFDHRGAGTQREIMLAIGDSVRQQMLRHVRSSLSYGIMTDEVSDVSVTENLVTFIQYFDSDERKVNTSFLQCQSVLENFDSANATAITELLKQSLQENNLPLENLTGFSSDGAAIMTGRINGVAAQLRRENPSLVNIHCVCHKLALACTHTNEEIKYIKEVEIWLRQLWTFFENSPKRMALYIKTQLALKNINLPVTKQGSSTVATRLKKACRTRWLSLEASVKAVFNDYEAILNTLDQLRETDPTASGLLKKMKKIKFLGVLYILMDVLPVLGRLSRCFQRDSLNFSIVTPQIQATQRSLQDILENETPLKKLEDDRESIEKIGAISSSPNQMEELQTVFKKYIPALKKNIASRFEESSSVVGALGVIFDPVGIPPSDSPDFKVYGNDAVQVLGTHFFQGEKIDKLDTEWQGMKYHIVDIVTKTMPSDIRSSTSKVTPTEWLLMKILNQTVYKTFFPCLYYVTSVAATLPISNAWPERGASAVKNLRTRQRSRLTPAMLDCLMQVCINGPAVEDASAVIKEAVDIWLKAKPRRKLHSQGNTSKVTKSMSTSEVQTDEVLIVDSDTVRQEVAAAMKALSLEQGQPDSDFDSDDESDLCCSL